MFRQNILSPSSWSKSKAKQETSRSSPLNLMPSSAAGFLLDLLVYPEDGGDVFLRNVGLLLNNMALRPTASDLVSFTRSVPEEIIYAIQEVINV
jgi:hypothetical protein